MPSRELSGCAACGPSADDDGVSAALLSPVAAALATPAQSVVEATELDTYGRARLGLGAPPPLGGSVEETELDSVGRARLGEVFGEVGEVEAEGTGELEETDSGGMRRLASEVLGTEAGAEASAEASAGAEASPRAPRKRARAAAAESQPAPAPEPLGPLLTLLPTETGGSVGCAEICTLAHPLHLPRRLRLPAAARGTSLVLGRAMDCDLQLDSLCAPFMLSRHHCRLEADDSGGWRIIDLGSQNGTSVNGRRLKRARPCALADGDVLCLGAHGNPGHKAASDVRYRLQS